MRRLKFQFLILPLIAVSACGEDTTAPEFPRAFTAVTDGCSMLFSLEVDSESRAYVETLMVVTEQSSSEPLFPARICFVIATVIDFSGEQLEKQVESIPCINEAGELEPPLVGIEAGPEEWHFTGAGTADGRSIEFVMEPLVEGWEPGDGQCGFATTGTVR